MYKLTIILLSISITLLLLSCGDDVSGPGEYVNPQYPDSLVQKISVGLSPSDIVAPFGSEYVYVSCFGSSCIMVADPLDTIPVDTIPVPLTPKYMIATPDGKRIYVSAHPDPYIFVVDTELNEIVQTISIGSNIMSIEITPSGDYVYAGCWMEKTVYVIRTVDNTVTDVLEFDWGPTCLEALPGGDYIYAGNRSVKEIRAIRISDQTLMNPIETEDYPSTMVASADGDYMFVFNKSNHDPRYVVVRLSDGENIASIRTRQLYVYGIRLPETNVAVLVRKDTGKVSILNMENRVFAPTITAGPDPVAVAISHDCSELYVADALNARIYIYR